MKNPFPRYQRLMSMCSTLAQGSHGMLAIDKDEDAEDDNSHDKSFSHSSSSEEHYDYVQQDTDADESDDDEFFQAHRGKATEADMENEDNDGLVFGELEDSETDEYLSRKQFRIQAVFFLQKQKLTGTLSLIALELKAMFSKQAEQELLQTVREFHTCKQEEGQSLRAGISICTGMGKTSRKGLKSQRLKTAQKLCKGGKRLKGKEQDGLMLITMFHLLLRPKTSPPPRRIKPSKGRHLSPLCEVGHWRRNIVPCFFTELMKKKKLPQGASASGIFTIELYSFPSKSWIYDTGCGTHICITTQGLRGSRKLKPGALSLYVGDGHRAAVEAIGTYQFCAFPMDLVIVLNNCHYAPSITRGVISVSRLFDDGFVNRFDDNNVISVSKDNLVYFMAVPRDGIFEIDMSCSNTNDSSIKKRIEKLQHDGLLNSIDIESLGKCVSCLSGKMVENPIHIKWKGLKIYLD
ncbi:hypothetical protein Tco_0978575 [Tanacetum coccineum]|uniref:Retrovirus-related Pol polyprotein from transposon TNT 1-94-like beta-barrel domain-containing protein n=1 Tax=Tanacetum coccineum TaxID=301880 RepID=A0ABQ5ENS3_9ASTR